MDKQKKNHHLLLVIIGLLVVIIILSIGGIVTQSKSSKMTKMLNEKLDKINKAGGNLEEGDITMTVINDKRCTDCETKGLIEKLKSIPRIQNATIVQKDFSDSGVSDYLKENNILKLPAIVFNSSNIDLSINQYLTKLPSQDYTLQVGSKYDPFTERSANGFRVIDKKILKDLLKDSYIKGAPDAKITWIEYSDLECPFCAKLYNVGTHASLSKKYGERLNILFQHFPLDFHPNALPGAEVIECLGKNKGINAFYSLVEKSFSSKNALPDFLIEEAVKLGGNKAKIQECYDNHTFKQKVIQQQQEGTRLFGISGTPGNILINNETGEYDILSGAYPISEFEKVIDKLLESK